MNTQVETITDMLKIEALQRKVRKALADGSYFSVEEYREMYLDNAAAIRESITEQELLDTVEYGWFEVDEPDTPVVFDGDETEDQPLVYMEQGECDGHRPYSIFVKPPVEGEDISGCKTWGEWLCSVDATLAFCENEDGDWAPFGIELWSKENGDSLLVWDAETGNVFE